MWRCEIINPHPVKNIRERILANDIEAIRASRADNPGYLDVLPSITNPCMLNLRRHGPRLSCGPGDSVQDPERTAGDHSRPQSRRNPVPQRSCRAAHSGFSAERAPELAARRIARNQTASSTFPRTTAGGTHGRRPEEPRRAGQGASTSTRNTRSATGRRSGA
jgi:hypothetical protein